jgi:hypothetical protein
VSEQGVPIDEVTAKDFIMVRAALVKRLGGANEALVWARIEYRASSAKHAHETGDGQLWWAATPATIGEEVGLSEDQVKYAIKKLRADGYLVAEQHYGSDRTMAYSPVIVHRADFPDGVSSGDSAPSTGEISTIHGAGIPDAPSTETSKTDKTTQGQRFAQPLCDVFAAQLDANGVKYSVTKKWLDDARLLVDRDGRNPHEARDLIRWACRDSFWRANILSMPTFRKQYDKLRLARERDGRKRGTVDNSRDALAILRGRQAPSGQKSVAS